MKDWKGNEIQVGQTLLRIDFKSMFGGNKSRIGFIFYAQDGSSRSVFGEEFETPHGYQWTIHDRFLITEPSNTVSVSFSSEIESVLPINMIDSWTYCQPWQVLCIEGISDNEEEFFRDHFKA